MDQSGKDSAAKAAWVTGGFALAGTVLTLLFAGPRISGEGAAQPAPAPFSATSPTTPPSTASTPTAATRTQPAALPDGLEGSWIGGVGKDSSRHLMLTKDAGYVL